MSEIQQLRDRVDELEDVLGISSRAASIYRPLLNNRRQGPLRCQMLGMLAIL